jgi:hypothetical protein
MFICNFMLPRATWFAHFICMFLSSFRTWTFFRFNAFQITTQRQQKSIYIWWRDIWCGTEYNGAYNYINCCGVLKFHYGDVAKHISYFKKVHTTQPYFALFFTIRPRSVQFSWMRSSEMPKGFHRTTQHYISEDGTLQIVKFLFWA